MKLPIILAFVLVYALSYAQNKIPDSLQKVSQTADAADTIIVAPQFQSGFIGVYCYHRIGSTFKTYGSAPFEWNRIITSNYRLSADSIHWIYAVIKNEGRTDRALKLYLNNVQTGIVRMYMVYDGKIDSSLVTGSLISSIKRPSLDRSLSIPFYISSGKTIELYLKTQRKETGITLTPLLADPLSTEVDTFTDDILIASLVFILFIVLVAAIVLRYFPGGEPLWFFLYALFGSLYILAASGFGSLYLWSDYPWFELNAAIFFGAAATSSFFEFSRRVLQINVSHPFLSKLIIVFSTGYIVIAFLGFGLYSDLIPSLIYSTVLQCIYLLILIFFMIILLLSIQKAIFQHKKEFWWFVSTFGFYILLSVVTILFEVGILPYNYQMHAYLLAFGSLPQMSLMMAFLIGRILSLLKKRERELAEERLQSQEKLSDERLRISRELHDDIGSTLGSISIYSEVAKSRAGRNQNPDEALAKIGNTSRELIDKMSDIVWSINPNNESFEQLQNRMEAFAAMMLTPRNIAYEFTEDESLKSMQFTMVERKNIFLIFKEAIHNIVKYASAKKVLIRLKKEDDWFRMLILDDGIGFDEKSISAYNGNGIKNMEARARDIKGQLRIQSEMNKGASIELMLKY